MTFFFQKAASHVLYDRGIMRRREQRLLLQAKIF